MHRSFRVETRGAGLYEITPAVAAWVAGADATEALLTLFVRHTSASLVIQENADPDVQADLVAWLGRLVPPASDPAMRYLRHVHNRSHCTFVPSRDTIADLDRAGFQNLELLPKGVDTRLFSPKKRDPLLRAEWGARGNGLVGLYVGRIAAEKNLPVIVRTFEEIRRRFPDFRGVFVGDGPKLKELRLAHPDFVYAGVRFGEDLARHYASADLFVFPSITETFGNVTLEAMASGLATVAYDYAAARQHIADGENGYTAPFDDDDAFVAAALRAASERVTLPALRENARAAARRVRWSKVIKRFEKNLVDLIERAFPGRPVDLPAFDRETEPANAA